METTKNGKGKAATTAIVNWRISQAEALIARTYEMVGILEALREERKAAVAGLHKLSESEVEALGLGAKLAKAEAEDRRIVDAIDRLRTSGQGKAPEPVEKPAKKTRTKKAEAEVAA